MIENKSQYRTDLFQLLRFVIVGVIATSIHYGIYLSLLFIFSANEESIQRGVSSKETLFYSIGYVISFVCNFALTCLFTFRKKASVQRGVGFGFAHIVNYCLHVGLLNLFLWLGISNKLAPIPVFCIAVPVNFLLVRFVFRRFRHYEYEQNYGKY